MKHRILLYLTITLFAVHSAQAQNAWPKEIPTGDGGTISVYEIQPDSFSGNTLKGSAAVSVRKTAKDEPVFGAILFTATTNTDNSSGMARITSMHIANAKFAEDQGEVERLKALIEKDAPDWKMDMSVDDLAAAAKQQNNAASGVEFNNDAPKIIYATKPTSLVVLDGSPRILRDKDLDADQVVNSPNLIFKEGKQWNLYIGGNWYKSNSVTSGWKQNTNLSGKVKSVNEQIKKQENENNNGGTPAAVSKITDIIVATEPTELLQTDGAPVYKTIAGTSLLYVSNSPNEIFKDINSQKTYVLIAGRWYNSTGMNGPWNYIASDKLPEDFASIPQGSDKETVLSNVAGTDAAQEARLDAQIPQTAKVDRRTATVNVEYDGDPLFNPIEGTSLQLAENANLTVIIDPSGRYFALDNGIWFVSDRANGPWSVANDRPRNIDDIPANNPAYHSKYVYVYDQTPDYVYYGYTSGYLGSYIWGPTIVYGTGYHYRPWFRRHYYPRPLTWGFGFIYDPWYGWNINYGYNYGYMYVGFDFGYGYGYGGGWFGPSRYCPSYRDPYWGGGYYGRYGRGNYYGNGYYGRNSGRSDYYGGNISGGRRTITSPGRGSGNINGRRDLGYAANTNIYNNQSGVITRDNSRIPNLTTPSTAVRANTNTIRPINDRYLNRLPANNNGSVRGNTNNENSRIPEINNTNPSANRDSRDKSLRPLNDSRNIRVNDPNRNSSPSVERPATNNRENAPLQNDRTIERQSRPIQNERVIESPSRPAQNERVLERQSRPIQNERVIERQSRPVQSERTIERQSRPVQRESNERQYSPPQRQNSDRQSAPAQRPSVQGGSDRGNNSVQGIRPGRR